jgi:hypothetical protein
MGELTPVKEIDGRKITNRSSGRILEDILRHFHSLIPLYSEKLN